MKIQEVRLDQKKCEYSAKGLVMRMKRKLPRKRKCFQIKYLTKNLHLEYRKKFKKKNKNEPKT